MEKVTFEGLMNYLTNVSEQCERSAVSMSEQRDRKLNGTLMYERDLDLEVMFLSMAFDNAIREICRMVAALCNQLHEEGLLKVVTAERTANETAMWEETPDCPDGVMPAACGDGLWPYAGWACACLVGLRTEMELYYSTRNPEQPPTTQLDHIMEGLKDARMVIDWVDKNAAFVVDQMVLARE